MPRCWGGEWRGKSGEGVECGGDVKVGMRQGRSRGWRVLRRGIASRRIPVVLERAFSDGRGVGARRRDGSGVVEGGRARLRRLEGDECAGLRVRRSWLEEGAVVGFAVGRCSRCHCQRIGCREEEEEEERTV